MNYIVVRWTRVCAGCKTTIKAGSYAGEDSDVPGIVFHGDICRALYWVWMAIREQEGGAHYFGLEKTKLPPRS